MKLDRLMGILTILMQKERVTAPYLAEKFEVNRRTITRDIDCLCRAGIPIVTHQGTGGGISISQGYRLDKSILTTEELSNIVSAIKGIGSVSATSHIESTLNKLGGSAVVSMQAPIVIDLASHYKDSLTPQIEILKAAIGGKHHVQFDYYYSKGNSAKCIEPYFIIFQWSSWYIFGFCTQRQDWRTFKLNRLLNLATLPTTYTPREIPPDRHDFYTHLADDILLTALFDPSEEYKLIETYSKDCYTHTPEGLLFKIGFTNQDYIVSWLLGFGSKVKVLEPPEVVEAIKDIAQNILQNYKT